MKKRMLVWMLVLCLLMTACGGDPGQESGEPQPSSGWNGLQPMPGFDAQNKYTLAKTAAAFQETEDFYCGGSLGGHFVHFYDKAGGISGVLCADPSCGHDSAACSAYMAWGASLSWYDGALYWVGKSTDAGDNDKYLWRNDLSGAGREKVKRLGFDEVILAYQPQQYVIHRGKLYMMGRANAVTESGAGQRVTLLSTPLDKFEEFTVLYDETFVFGSEATVRFVGNSVYYAMLSWPESRIFDLKILRFDLTSGGSELLYEEFGITDPVGSMWVTEQGEIYLPFEGRDGGGSLWKVENGSRTEIMSWADEYCSVKPMEDIVVNLTVRNREDGSRVRYVDIRDYTGEQICSGRLFPDTIPGMKGDPNAYNFAVVGGDREKLILSLSADEGKNLCYTVLVELSSMETTVLWSEER